MRHHQWWQLGFLTGVCFLLINGCANSPQQPQLSTQDTFGLPSYHGQAPFSSSFNESKYASLLPQKIHLGKEKVILIDPKVFAWGAYDREGNLVRAGIATAGSHYCQDIGRPCRTAIGTFKLYSLGDAGCISRTYPIPDGGSLMPYCMFFHRGQSLHGTPDQMMTEEHISHGCVHLRIPDAEWLRYNFANIGTKVVILPY
jgi:hypothetical protein